MLRRKKMLNDRRRILDMLEQGKINAADAERLLSALGSGESAAQSAGEGPSGRSERPRPRYLRVVVAERPATLDNPTVNIRVPLQLLRAGMRFSSLLPESARVPVEGALKDKGFSFDLKDISPEMLEEFVDAFAEFSLDVNDDEDQVRIFCE